MILPIQISPLSAARVFAGLLVLGLLLTGCGSGTDAPDAHGPDEHAAADAHDSDEHGHDEHGAERSEITLASASLASLDLETIEVQERPVGAAQVFPGRVVPVPDQEAMVTSLLAGRIEEVLANEGDRVQQGQPLALVTGPELGDLIAELRHTRADLERQQRLAERGVGIEKNLIEAQTAYDAARQHLRAIGLAPEEVEDLATGAREAPGVYLRAPTNGLILERTATQGGPVAPGQVLFHLADLAPIWVEADVYERDLPQLHEGLGVQVRAAASADRAYGGTVRQILPHVDQERRVATVRIQLPNEGEVLKPGMYATVDVVTASEVQPALPVDAVMTDGARSYVIVAENDSTFRRVNVGAPADAAGYVAVPELPVGTRVVTTGAFQIHSAMSGVEAGHAH
ncbi:MAG: efflux RND transporter periplasmic adaptor subunit [Bacteroidetes bacterium]|jgi:cobalt-zinc-cadmium efflux system membrane fusion protein|nr:efflux RND transporter periplasmic adaptor subunit [Bacteroidota bacterium]